MKIRYCSWELGLSADAKEITVSEIGGGEVVGKFRGVASISPDDAEYLAFALMGIALERNRQKWEG